MLGAALTDVLRAARPSFNAAFVEARRRLPALEADAFKSFLIGALDPLAEAVARACPERTSAVVQLAYDAALELVGQRLAGPSARTRAVDDGWRTVLVAAAPLVGGAPERVIAAISNALVQLAMEGGASATRWCEMLAAIAPECPDVDTLLQVGKVAAWRAGLAHYRDSALAVADALPEVLVLRLFGMRPGVSWGEVRPRLAVDPWFDPATAEPGVPLGPGRLRVMGRVGAFRGFGGLFVSPPTVYRSQSGLKVTSGEEQWLLCADVFGSTLHRATVNEAASVESALPAGMLSKGASVTRGNQRVDLPELRQFSSLAASEHTLALTSPLSHAVVLVALT